jgi:hypothetical protein
LPKKCKTVASLAYTSMLVESITFFRYLSAKTLAASVN